MKKYQLETIKINNLDWSPALPGGGMQGSRRSRTTPYQGFSRIRRCLRPSGPPPRCGRVPDRSALPTDRTRRDHGAAARRSAGRVPVDRGTDSRMMNENYPVGFCPPL